MTGVGAGNTPSAMLRSEWQTPQCRTCTRTWPGRGSAMVTSSCRTSGFPACSRTAARMARQASRCQARRLPEQRFGQLAAEAVGQRMLGAEHREEVEHRLAGGVVGELPIPLHYAEQLGQRILVPPERRERAAEIETSLEIVRVRGETRAQGRLVARAVAAGTQLGRQALRLGEQRRWRRHELEQ